MEGTYTETKINYWDNKIDCTYLGKCESEGFKCGDCKHNNNSKDDHYEPRKLPYVWPHYTTYPYFNPLPDKGWTITCFH